LCLRHQRYGFLLSQPTDATIVIIAISKSVLASDSASSSVPLTDSAFHSVFDFVFPTFLLYFFFEKAEEKIKKKKEEKKNSFLERKA
jgi:hypothetical protein